MYAKSIKQNIAAQHYMFYPDTVVDEYILHVSLLVSRSSSNNHTNKPAHQICYSFVPQHTRSGPEGGFHIGCSDLSTKCYAKLPSKAVLSSPFSVWCCSDTKRQTQCWCEFLCVCVQSNCVLFTTPRVHKVVLCLVQRQWWSQTCNHKELCFG